jgi:hypothetical protein
VLGQQRLDVPRRHDGVGATDVGPVAVALAHLREVGRVGLEEQPGPALPREVGAVALRAVLHAERDEEAAARAEAAEDLGQDAVLAVLRADLPLEAAQVAGLPPRPQLPRSDLLLAAAPGRGCQPPLRVAELGLQAAHGVRQGLDLRPGGFGAGRLFGPRLAQVAVYHAELAVDRVEARPQSGLAHQPQ